MRVLFAGTPEFSVAALTAIHQAGHEIALVLTQPDRPAGRGMSLAESPVKQAARKLGLEVVQPRTLRDEAIQTQLRRLAPDVMVVVAYGLILPQAVLDIPRYGALNIHASLLPRWRGAAPIQRAIEAGDAATGITIMRMDAGLDTGPMLLREETAIHPADTAATLHDRLQAIGARLIVVALDGLHAGSITETDQPSEGVTYAKKLSKEEAAIDWTRGAQEIGLRIRAFDPVPGAFTTLGGTVWKIWSGQPVVPGASSVPPGTVTGVAPDGIEVQTGDGLIRLTVMQKAGGRRLTVDQVLRGNPIAPGDRFGSPASG